MDETGTAEIALETLVVSRSGPPSDAKRKPPHWTPAILTVAETMLCGGRATIKDVLAASAL